MSDPQNKAQEALYRIAEKLAEDVLNATDAEIRAEAKEDGIDIAAEATRSRAIFAKALTAQGKRRMATARAAINAQSRTAGPAVRRFSPEQARQMLARALRDAPETSAKLTMAARKGQDLTDADVYGMLDDLADLGLLPPSNDKGAT